MRNYILSAVPALLLAAPVQQAAATTPPGLINMVIAGQPDPANVVPQFNIAPGSQVNNLSVAIPESILTHGATYIYWVSFESVSFSGTCTVSYDISQKINGKSKILQAAKILKFQCGPGQYGAGIPGAAVPNSPGVATLTGTVAYGSTKAKLSTTVVIQ
jgi:hypothetical protein